MCKNKEDKCGPMVSPWSGGIWKALKTRVLAWAVPDGLWGICIAKYCAEHDKAYTRGGSYYNKRSADRLLREDIYEAIYQGLMEQGVSNHKANTRAKLVAELYYRGVRNRIADEQFNWLREFPK